MAKLKRWLLLMVAVVTATTSFAFASASEQTCNGLPPTTAEGTDGDDVIIGSPSRDHIRAGEGNDTICAGGGSDSITAGPGDDFIDGGGGNDLLELDSADPLNVNLATGQVTGEGTDRVVLGSVEGVDAGCGEDADTIVGDADDNFLYGGPGDDAIRGGDGTDELYGHRYDSADIPTCPDDFGYSDSDVLVGDDGDDVLYGAEGSDTLDGGNGFDALDGGGGFDECSNGERYNNCATQDPPAPAPQCSDGVDNDGDGGADYGFDGACRAPLDPTEHDYNDPECYDGVDNDADGNVDFLYDAGCRDYEDYDEYYCQPMRPCAPRATISIEFLSRRQRFVGVVRAPDACLWDRRIVLIHHGGEGAYGDQIDKTRSRDDGRWVSKRIENVRGRYSAVARQEYTRDAGDSFVTCDQTESRRIRPRNAQR